MKALFITLTALLIIKSSMFAQGYKKTKVPPWVSDKGFWQIETTIKNPGKNIVYFYTNDNVLIYRENVEGVIFDLGKKRVKMQLKRALETAVIAWNRDRIFETDQQRVTGLFKK